MNMKNSGLNGKLNEIARRIHEMRDVVGYSITKMSELTEVSEEEYAAVEAGELDPSFTFLHKCALAFGVDITALMEGHSAKLSGYMVTRAGQGPITAKEDGIEIRNMAAMFKNRLATPYEVTYKYDEKLQNVPIHTSTHAGQEFDLILKGSLKVKVGEHVEILHPGDAIFYKSSTPHGMIAVDGEDCTFLAMIMAGNEMDQDLRVKFERSKIDEKSLVVSKFVEAEEDESGKLKRINFKNTSHFNFAFDVVDEIARRAPEKLAMLHVSDDFKERRFTFGNMREESNRVANYLLSLGIKRGDKVMLVLKRHYQFWYSILALHKIGAVAIPATNQLMVHDFTYRFKAGDVKAILCTGDGDTAAEADKAIEEANLEMTKIMVNGSRESWHNFDAEYREFSPVFNRPDDAPGGDNPMLMFFTSGTTGYPKMALHSYKYALGHYVTAKYWHLVEPGGLHFTMSETGWGKALWGKLYGQWLCEGAIFTYDFARFDADKVLPMFARYNITTFCAPPTIYRMLIKEDISKYDLSSIHHATTAGEALNPEVFTQFKRATGLSIAEGFGQTEMTLGLAILNGDEVRLGSMGKPVPGYGIDLVDSDGNSVPPGDNGEIVIRSDRGDGKPGLFLGYYKDEEKTSEVWHDGMYRTGDLAWRDEDGYYHYVGRADDVIKSSGYRIGPAEIEHVIMELPYVLECGVSAAPDDVRGQVVKASIVLVKGKEPSEELKKEIQTYVKEHTAPYKYPRIVVFRESLPKTISGKIQRNLL
jgi:acetyl-CoA synthetase